MTDTTTTYGVHSEVGTVRKVLVCSPDFAHARLTPSNCEALLFDDVLWVERAKCDHFDFVSKIRERGIEVLEMHSLLAEKLPDPNARK
jgi:arginine deiminase